MLSIIISAKSKECNIYKAAALPILRILSLEVVAPPCGEEGAAMDKPPCCSKGTGHFCAAACSNSRKARRNHSFF